MLLLRAEGYLQIVRVNIVYMYISIYIYIGNSLQILPHQFHKKGRKYLDITTEEGKLQNPFFTAYKGPYSQNTSFLPLTKAPIYYTLMSGGSELCPFVNADLM